MKVGDKVTVEGSLAKDGSHTGNARSVTLVATGKQLFAASSQGTTPLPLRARVSPSRSSVEEHASSRAMCAATVAVSSAAAWVTQAEAGAPAAAQAPLPQARL